MDLSPWDVLGDVLSPVEIRHAKKEMVDGVQLIRFEYLSHKIGGVPLWVAAIYGCPDQGDGSYPGLVHIHGGTETACEDHVSFFARKGYGILSFDWTGPQEERDPSRVTLFPDSVKTMDDRNGPVDRMRVFHVVWMARRALTFLESLEEIDVRRLGVFGVSWGGLMAWLVNGLDSRVQAMVALYGCGLADEDQETDAWLRTFQPKHYAESLNGDVLFMNGTNDFFGHLDVLYSFWDQIPKEKRLVLTPNEDHGNSHEGKITATKWLDWKLKGKRPLPAAPSLSLQLQDGGLSAEVYAPEAKQVRIFYAISPSGALPSNYWYLGPWGDADDGFFTSRWTLPIGSRRVQVFAEALYEDGCKQHSICEDAFEGVGTVALQGVDDSIWYDPLMHETPWYTRWCVRGIGLTPGKGRVIIRKSNSDGRLCLAQTFDDSPSRFEGYLRRPACSVVGRGDGCVLSISLWAHQGGKLVLTASKALGNQKFDECVLGDSFEIQVKPRPIWQTIRILPESWNGFALGDIRQLKLFFEAKFGPSVEIGRIETTD
ncbi:MAG: acetylxylan esterase [Verrucomicrobiota bacterium]